MNWNKVLKGALLTMVLISILVASTVIQRRMVYERDNKQVEVALSLRHIQTLALLGGLENSELLQKVKEETSITTVAVEEETIQDFVDSGRITLLKGSEIINMHRVGHINRFILHNLYKKVKIKPERFYIIVDRKDDYTRIRDFLTAELGKERVKRIDRLDILEVINEGEDLLELGLGLSKDVVKELSGYGFNIIARLKNSERSNWNIIRLKMGALKDLDQISTLVFDGKSVLGYPNEIEFTQGKIDEFDLKLGYIEFANQFGFKALVDNRLNSVVRVHSISESEIKNLTSQTALARYVRAVKERGNKILFLQSIPTKGKGVSSIDSDILFFNTVTEAITNAGYRLGAIDKTTVLELRSIQSWELLVISLGVLIILLYFIQFYLSLNIFLWLGSFVAVIISFYLFNLTSLLDVWVRSLSLIVAIVFPSLAIISQFPKSELDLSLLSRFWDLLVYISKVFIITLLGALYISAILNDIHYLLSVKLFFGVKLSLIIPLLLIGLYFFLQPHRMSSIFYVFKRMFNSPVRTLQLVSVVFLFGFVFIYILRSGNYISLDIPMMELFLRDSTESLFSIRPRTKEFLIGYPLLFLTFLYVDRGLSRHWVWFFNGLGSVALISMINSFCHLHTPLLVSTYRSILGLVLGVLVCVVYCLIIEGLKFTFKLKKA